MYVCVYMCVYVYVYMCVYISTNICYYLLEKGGASHGTTLVIIFVYNNFRMYFTLITNADVNAEGIAEGI